MNSTRTHREYRFFKHALAAVCATTLLAGCLGLKPVSDPTRFYVLSASGPSEPLAEAAQLSQPVFVAPVETPAYLDRLGIVVRSGNNRVDYSELHHWAEPMRDGFNRCLRSNLAHLLGSERVHPLRYRRPSGQALEVQVSLQRLELAPAGQAVLSVHWQLVQAPTGRVLQSQQTTLSRDYTHDPADFTPAVAALSECMMQLSREIAAALLRTGARPMP